MTDQNIETSLDQDGVLLARIDMPGRTMNVFSLEMMDSLDRLIDRVLGDEQVVAVVLASGKRAFLAGADLAMIRMFTERARTDTHVQLVELCGRLGRIFRRLECSPKPFVVAVDGIALGGGLELCLACHGRVVSDRRGVLLGLPEIKLGLLPGAGGTQRLPRMVGARLGLEMLLRGEPLKAAAALECGVVDEIAPAEQLIERARARALALRDARKPWDIEGTKFASGAFALEQDGAHERIAQALDLSPALLAHYPAYRAIMDCVVQGWIMPMDAALANEMDIFVRLIQDPVAGNMVRSLFLDRQRSLKVLDGAPDAGAVRVALLGSDAAELGKALAAAGVEVVDAGALERRDVAVLMGGHGEPPAATCVAYLQGRECMAVGAETGCRAGVWAAARSPHGRVVEVVWNGDPLARAAAVLIARSLRPDGVLVSFGREPVLPQLAGFAHEACARGLDEDGQILAVAQGALEALAEGRVADEALLDSAVVVAGLVPAYCGGPFAFLRQLGETEAAARLERARALAPELFGSADRLGEFFGGARHGA
ncbi:MAG: enoyl-CoA hydratase-related protein [Thauera propionica]|nr:enoyl-CoA hydratase-related protein [Thauera propionica]